MVGQGEHHEVVDVGGDDRIAFPVDVSVLIKRFKTLSF